MNDMVQSEVLGIVRGIMNCRKAGIRDASGTKRILTVSRRSFGSIWGFPNLSPPAIAGAFGKKTIVLPIRWTAAVGGRSRLPKVPSGNENSTRTRGFPRGREKGRAAWQRPCCPARYFPLWVCRLCAALSKSVRRGIRSLFFCGREQGARARRRELLSPIKSPCWQVRKGSCRRSGR